VGAIASGLAYLGWRAVATREGVPAGLWWPAFVVEALGVLGVIVLLLALRRRPQDVDTSRPATAKVDVMIRVQDEPVGRLVATLAGLRHTKGVASSTILLFDIRPEIATLAEEHGIAVLVVDPVSDSTGLKTAMQVGRSPFIALLDAGDVPLPGFADVLVRHAYDGHVAGVRGAVGAWSTDSAEHDSRGRHELRFEREVLNPAAGQAAVLNGSGVLLRRWAVGHVGVPSGPRRTAELRLSMRLRAAGLRVVAPADPVLVSAFSANNASAVARERRRDTAAVLTMLVSTDGPIWNRSLSLADRIAILGTCVRPLSGLRRAMFLAVLTAALLLGELPFHASPVTFAAFWVPAMVLQSIAFRSASLGRLGLGDRARWSFSTMGASVAGLLGAGQQLTVADKAAPRTGGLRELTANRPLTATLAVLGVTVPVVAVSDRFTHWLPDMDNAHRGLLFAVTVWSIVVMLDVLRCLNGARQMRRAPRVATQFDGAVNESGATIVDLTPYGAGAIVMGDLAVGDEVEVGFDVPTMNGQVSIAARGLVRSTRHTGEAYVYGIEFISMDYASSDALYEYCEVVHTIGWFSSNGEVPDDTRELAAKLPPVMVPPRRVGVRLAAVGVLAGVCVATAPPFAATQAAPTTTGGTLTVHLFQDFNGNGVRNLAGDATNPAVDVGVAGATITATCLADNGGDATAGTGDGETYATPVTLIDNGDGSYVYGALPGTPCRVEATALPAGYSPGPLGADNAGLVQFAGEGDDVLMGINKPEEFCQNNPQLVTACMRFGDPVNGAASSTTAISTFSYFANGSEWGGPTPTETPTPLATTAEVGSVFGFEYSRTRGTIFTSAYTKVYAGYGPGGIGAIYAVDPAGGGATVFATIPNAGSLPARAGYAPNPNSVSGDWLQDGQYWDAVGTTSLGDIQLTPDESTLWVVNLNTRQLVPVDATTGAVGTPIAIPLATGAAQSCAAGQVRPFGLGLQGDTMLVGEVCAGPSTSDLRMYVYGFDTDTNTFDAAPLFESSLVYTRGKAGNNCGPNTTSADWNAWTATNVFNGSTSPAYCSYPQAMLTDIVVDVDGSLILGLRDRFGDQAGEDVPAGAFGGGGEGVSAGDTLRACPSGNTWVLENNGVCGTRTSQASGSTQGPGGKEFYTDGFATPTGPGGTHQEITLGGLAQVPGFTTVVTTNFDPSTTNGSDWRSGGIRRVSNNTGFATGFFQLFDKCDSSGTSCPSTRTKTLTFGKVNGMGDVVALCDMAPIEIGNRVWSDTNGNGAQDPGEPGLPGVPVTFHIGGNQYTATTDSDGVYLFSSDDRTADTASANYDIPEMTAGATGTLTFPLSVTVSGSPRAITTRDASGTSDTDDSDAAADGTVAVTLGAAGDNDHDYDVGYGAKHSLGNLVWDDEDNDGVADNGESGIDGVTVRLYADADDNGVPDGAALDSQVTSNGGYYLFTGLWTGTYVVEVVTPSGYRTSSGTNGSTTGPYEGIATPDVDTNPADDDDNGNAIDVSGAIVRSRPISLGAFEPTGEPATPGHSDPAADERSNTTADFGFYRPLSVGNLVWDDVDNDGAVTSGEPGLPGVSVTLLEGGNPLATTTTDTDGQYLFTDLATGEYVVQVATPATYQTSTGNSTEPAPDPDLDDTDDDDNGTAVAMTLVESAPFVLAPGTEPTADADDRPTSVSDAAADDGAEYTVDFGFWRPVSIGDLVWSDLDDDGTVDVGEPGLPGVSVRLYAADGTTEVNVGPDGILGNVDDAAGGMVTDANGHYRFQNLPPATYRVQWDVPAGSRTSSVADVGDANDDTNDDNNGGQTKVGTTTSGHLMLVVGSEPTTDGDSDTNSNLTVDMGVFTPSPAMTLVKYTNGCDADTATGADGPAGGCPPGDGSKNPVVATGSTVTWSFVVHNAGNVTLTDAQVTDDHVAQTDIDCNGATAGNGQPFTLGAGASLTCFATGTATAGQYANTGTLRASGETVPAQPPTPLTPVTEDSHYFAGDPGLALKKYTVVADPGASNNGVLTGPAPAVTGTDDADVAGGIDPIANHIVGDGATVWWLYAVTNTGNVQLDAVQVTDDKEGSICQNLTIAAGDTVWCVTQGTVTRAETTDGQYSNIGTATGLDMTTNPSAPTDVGPVTDPSHVYVPVPAIQVKKYTNGFDADTPETRPEIDAGLGVTWTYVVTNTGDWPLATISLVDDLEGTISCPVLPGNPSQLDPGASITCTETGVATVQPNNVDYVNTATVTGTPVPPQAGTLPNPVDDDPSGYKPLVAAIGDFVWIDADVDGIQDTGEEPVADVTVRLLTPGGVLVATTTTDPTGFYEFVNLDPGTYVLEFVPPADTIVTTRDAGADDAVDSDVDPATKRTVPTELVGGEIDHTWDLGLYELAALGDTVWYDRDLDGVQDTDEAPVVGVTVQLFSAGGTSLATTTTDSNGNYLFSSLMPGGYVVQFSAPSGYDFTVTNAGADDTVDSDADARTGQTQVVELSSGEYDPTIDAGVYQTAAIGDVAWEDTNADGLQTTGEIGIGGVSVLLTDSKGVAIATTVTAADGTYSFTGLEPGIYGICFAGLPSGYDFSGQDVGSDDTVDSDADTIDGCTVTTELTGGEFDRTWDAGINRGPASNVIPPTATTPTPTVGGLPVTGGNVLQLLLFASSVLMIGLLLLKARRPRTL
jgi:protocatechuate 3,4-dioxygenase beta subunit/cellulose synthase/poly-beta-1,6-N-acetylglucosamine synthase-like glycosyltransferase